MKYSILLCLGTATLLGCASVDDTVTQTTTDTPHSNIRAPAQTITASPAEAQQLYKQGYLSEAFDMNYALATRGDDRSQYNIGVSYHNGIEGKVRPDYVEAYAWMITSEMEIQKPTRIVGLNALKDKLSEEKQRVAQQRAAELFDQYGSGDRAQSGLELITSIENARLPNRACSKLGSKLKRDCQGARQFKDRKELYDSPITF